MGKKPKQPINEQFFAVRKSLLNSELFKMGLLTGDDWKVFLAYGNEFKGKKHQLLEITFNMMRHNLNNNKNRFAKAKFHLAAYRLLYFPNLGAKSRKGSKARINMKWKTLILMPDKLTKIANWVKKVDELMDLPSKVNPKQKQSKNEFLQLRRRQIERLKNMIFEEPV